MNDPQRTLEALAQLARSLADSWPTYEATEATLSLATITSGSGDHRGTDTPDPTSNIATSHERYYETVALTAEAFGILRDIQNRHARVRQQHPAVARDIDRALDAARCTGIVGDDPLCTRNAVRDVTHQGTPQPTCWACIKRSQRTRIDGAA
jgi:hypothetical protein